MNSCVPMCCTCENGSGAESDNLVECYLTNNHPLPVYNYVTCKRYAPRKECVDCMKSRCKLGIH